MAAERLILDASVVVKWFHDEPGTPDALRLQELISENKITAAVPDLLLYEVSNVLVRGIGTSANEIANLLHVLIDLSWDIVPPSEVLLNDAVSLAVRHNGLTVYDAMYVALALRRNAILVTADAKLHRLIGAPVTRLLSRE